jgi:hypothetical protein
VETIALLRDISVVIIALEVFVICLVPGVILFFIVKGLFWVERKIKYFAPLVQYRFRQVADITEKTSQKVAAPVMSVNASAARVRRVRQVI